MPAVAWRTDEHLCTALRSCTTIEAGCWFGIHRLVPSSRSDVDKDVLRMGYWKRIPCSRYAGRDTNKTVIWRDGMRPIMFEARHIIRWRNCGRMSLTSWSPLAWMIRISSLKTLLNLYAWKLQVEYFKNITYEAHLRHQARKLNQVNF